MKSTVVFQIEEHMVKCLRVSNTPKKVVTAVDVIQVSGMSDAQVSVRLEQWIKDRRITFKETYVVALVPRARCILRYMTLPSHQESEVRDMIDLQVANHIPFAREEVEVDFQILTKSADGYSKAAVVILHQDAALRYWKIFEDAHIPVNTLTLSTVGLWLLGHLQPNLPNQLFGIIDLDVHASEICMCEKDYWLASREIPVGLKNLRAEGNKEFIRQCKLTQENMAKEKIGQNIRVMYVVTTAGNLGSMSDELSVAMGCIVKEIDVLKGLPMAKNIQWSQSIMEDAVSMAPLVGVALSPQPPRLNLVPRAVRERRSEKARSKELIMCGIWLAAALIVGGLIVFMNFYKSHVRLSQADKRLELAMQQAKPIEQKLKVVRAAEQHLAQRALFGEWMNEVFNAFPPGISLTSLELSNGNIIAFEGITSNVNDVSMVQQSLASGGVFTNVRLDYVNKRATQEGEFNYFKITGMIKAAQGTNEKVE